MTKQAFKVGDRVRRKDMTIVGTVTGVHATLPMASVYFDFAIGRPVRPYAFTELTMAVEV